MPSPSPLAGEGKLLRSDSRERGRVLRSRAKAMRSDATDAEHRLWQLLRAHRFEGFKFRRQVPIDFYIVDFVCLGERLVVELDGGQHVGSAWDEARDAYLERQGFRVLRFWNNELFTHEDGVAEMILSALRAPLSPTPLPRGERG